MNSHIDLIVIIFLQNAFSVAFVELKIQVQFLKLLFFLSYPTPVFCFFLFYERFDARRFVVDMFSEKKCAKLMSIRRNN